MTGGLKSRAGYSCDLGEPGSCARTQLLGSGPPPVTCSKAGFIDTGHGIMPRTILSLRSRTWPFSPGARVIGLAGTVSVSPMVGGGIW